MTVNRMTTAIDVLSQAETRQVCISGNGGGGARKPVVLL